MDYARKAAWIFYKRRGSCAFDEFEDVEQDARLVALIETKKNPELTGEKLCRTIVWRLIDRFRSKTDSRRRRRNGLAPILIFREGDLEDDPEFGSPLGNALERLAIDAWREKESAIFDELLEAFERNLKRESPRYREFFRRWADGESIASAARSLGLPESTAKVRVNQMKRNVKTALTK